MSNNKLIQNILAKGQVAVDLFLRQHPIIIVGIITIFGALLRFYHLDYKALSGDEAGQYWIAQGSFSDVIAQVAAVHYAPPLFTVLVNLVLTIDHSETVIRGVSWLAGSAAIPAIYFLARQFLSKNAAYFSIFIVAIAVSQIQYSQQLREYSVTFLLAILMLTFFYKQLQEPNWKNWGLLVLTWSLGLFTQYGLALLIFGLNLVFMVDLLFQTNRKTKLIQWTLAQLVVLGAVIVVYQFSLKHQMDGIGLGGTANSVRSHYLAKAYWDGSPLSLVRLTIGNTIDIFDFAYPGFLFLFSICLGILAAFKERHGRVALMMFIFPLGCTFIAATAGLYPYGGERQAIFLTPMIYILAGFGFVYLSRLDKTQNVLLILVLILGLNGIRSTYRYLQDPGPENIKPLIKTLSASFQIGDRIYVYYGAKNAFSYYYRSNQDRWIHSLISREQPDKYLQQLDEILTQPGRVWMFFSHCYEDECELIPDRASRLRNVGLMTSEDKEWLYLAY